MLFFFKSYQQYNYPTLVAEYQWLWMNVNYITCIPTIRLISPNEYWVFFPPSVNFLLKSPENRTKPLGYRLARTYEMSKLTCKIKIGFRIKHYIKNLKGFVAMEIHIFPKTWDYHGNMEFILFKFSWQHSSNFDSIFKIKCLLPIVANANSYTLSCHLCLIL